MSDLFRIPAIDLTTMTVRELARQCHIAEGSDDDILMMNVYTEGDRRERVTVSELTGLSYKHHDVHDLFMDHYRDLWRTEFNPNRSK